MGRIGALALVLALTAHAQPPDLRAQVEAVAKRSANVSTSIEGSAVTATIDLGDRPWWVRGAKTAFMAPVIYLSYVANDHPGASLHFVILVQRAAPLTEEVPEEFFDRCTRANESTWGWIAKNSKHPGQVSYEVRCVQRAK